MSTPGRAAPSLAIRLFGPLDVRVNDRPLRPLRSRKGQGLLALLILRRDREVRRDWLAGTLWPESSQEQALANLRRTLTDLRRALGPAAGRLRSTTPSTLSLDLAGADVDVVAFDEAVGRGDAASLETAVALYRGPLLEGCVEEWVLPERMAREQACLGALETLATQALANGDACAAARCLRRVIAVDPLRESAYRALMRALAATGDCAAVVDLYRDLRLLLRRELNAEPDSETTALFQQIRDEIRRSAEEGMKERREGGIQSPVIPSSLPSFLPSRLPRPLTALVGREQETREIKARLGTARLATLTGTGGVGKTRLAIQVAEEVAGDFPDGTYFVDFAPLSDPVLVPQTVASVLDVSEEPGRSLTDTLTDFLHARRLLLVLDNCEHLLGACARLAFDLLQRSPHLKILATSRQPLGLTGEVAWRVPSLSCPDFGLGEGRSKMERDPVSLLMEYDAVRLFVERAVAAMPVFRLIPQNAPAVAQVCRQLDGIPLAIELAAARLRALSIEQLAARLDDRFRLLTGGSRTALPRQQTLRALIDWSYDLLDEPERALLRRLSVFAGGWTLEAAEAVAGDGAIGLLGSPSPDTLDLLTSLVDRSLVQFEAQDGEGRYRLLETIRQYARERLREAGEEGAARARHGDYYLALAEEAEPHLIGAEQAAWLDRLEREHDNLRAAMDFGFAPLSTAIENGDVGLRFVGALWRFWSVRGHVGEGRERAASVLARPENQAPTGARAKALNAAANLAQDQGDYVEARARCEEALAIRRALEDRQGVAGCLNGLGLIATDQGEYARARSLHEEALAIRREEGDRWGVAGSLNNLGNVAQLQGDFETARPLYEESLAIFREMGDRRGTAITLNSLGLVAHALGDYAGARAAFEESLSIFREVGDRYLVAWLLNALGLVVYSQGDYEAARALYGESLEIRQELGDRRGIATALTGLGAVAHQQGKEEEARALQEESLTIRREIGDRRGVSECLEALAEILHAPSAMERAVHLYGASDALRAALGDETFAAAWSAGRALTMEQAVEYALRKEVP